MFVPVVFVASLAFIVQAAVFKPNVAPVGDCPYLEYKSCTFREVGDVRYRVAGVQHVALAKSSKISIREACDLHRKYGDRPDLLGIECEGTTNSVRISHEATDGEELEYKLRDTADFSRVILTIYGPKTITFARSARIFDMLLNFFYLTVALDKDGVEAALNWLIDCWENLETSLVLPNVGTYRGQDFINVIINHLGLLCSSEFGRWVQQIRTNAPSTIYQWGLGSTALCRDTLNTCLAEARKGFFRPRYNTCLRSQNVCIFGSATEGRNYVAAALIAGSCAIPVNSPVQSLL